MTSEKTACAIKKKRKKKNKNKNKKKTKKKKKKKKKKELLRVLTEEEHCDMFSALTPGSQLADKALYFLFLLLLYRKQPFCVTCS